MKRTSKFPFRARRAGGFTLLELLVVISVIALLLGIALPSFARARIQSKRTRCLANMRSISQALQARLNEHHDYFPAVSQLPSDPDLKDPPIFEALDAQLGGSREVFNCPADRITKESEKAKSTVATYFEREGTSYEWLPMFNDKKIDQRPDIYEILNLPFDPKITPLMYDYEAFHGGDNAIGSVVTIFADLSVRADSSDIYKGPGD